MNIAMLLQMASESCPERIALTHDGKNYSYKQLYEEAQVAASMIRNENCSSVAILDTSSPAIPIAMMAAAIIGIPYIPLNFRLTTAEINALVERISPAYLIIGDEFDVALDIKANHTRSDFLTQTQNLQAVNETWNEDPTSIAVQLFTSGTTGTPKAAILRHEHLVSYILSSVEFMGAQEDEATLVSVPPYHIAGIAAILSSIYACRRVVQLSNFSANSWIDLCHSEQITNAFVVPTMLTRIIEHLNSTGDLNATKHLQAIAYGGGKMPLKVIEKALAIFPNINFTNAYGLTETSSTVTLLSPDDHKEARKPNNREARQRLGSVGKALPSIEIQIRNENNQVLEPNETGEIFVRGPQVSGEYEEKNAIEKDGWFPTRDAGFLDTEGYLYLAGRTDDIIVRGGENISPGEIEDVLLSHPEIIDAAVVGNPSAEWGESVVAMVVSASESVRESELQNLVKSELRSSRVPEQIKFVKELPYNETGKLLRRIVKESFE